MAGNASFRLPGHAVGFDIRYPDALVDSAALSRLPADMIRTPFLRALLTRDFVDYYQSNATRLSAEGMLLRLAFEHDLDWMDELIRRMFAEPSRVLLWRSPDGCLGYWVMTMHRNGLAKLAQAIGNLAASDTQLSKVAELSGNVPVYALRLAIDHTLLFAAKGDRLLILSEPGILLGKDNQLLDDRAQALARMLDDGGDEAIQAYHLDGSGSAREHRLVVSVKYLSFGYQAFFPDIAALRFDCAVSGKRDDLSNRAEGNSSVIGPTTLDMATDSGGGWSTAALIDPAHLPQHWNSGEVWRVLPVDAAACASLPVDWNDAADMVDKLGNSGQAAAKVLREQMTGPVGVCWYAKSTLVAPVFVARLNPKAAQDAAQLAGIKSALASAFGDAIGAFEARADKAQGDYADGSGQSGSRRMPVETRELPGGAILWTRPVSARAGTEQGAQSPYASQLSAPRYFPVTLALAQGYVVFSPDRRLVDDTLAVLDKRYPAVADAPRRRRTVPPRWRSLRPPPQQPCSNARQAAHCRKIRKRFCATRRAHRLLPKLHAAAGYPPFALSLPATLPSSTEWVPVEWHFETPSGPSATPASGDGGSFGFNRPHVDADAKGD